MPSSLTSGLALALTLSVIVFVVAAFAEGRAQHLVRIILRVDERRGMDHVYDEVEREDNAWELLHGIDSEPESVSGGERAAAWAREAAAEAREVAITARDRVQALRASDVEAATATGEIALPRH
ncbi:hypothetical protein [Demequina sp. NBRC 110051]|uniref:hypothetical protein n=1 Tax=Demequina sp. NBRC 110051 TaxID=1570340 RepID=UPI0009FFD379|nr:hypothetical protein [Demequina sp. NBRC 110051]